VNECKPLPPMLCYPIHRSSILCEVLLLQYSWPTFRPRVVKLEANEILF